MTYSVSTELLAPAAILVLWTLLILLWMMVRRFSGFRSANISLAKAPPGGRGQDLEGVLPGPYNWPAHNYAHLVEQPTVFYAIIIILTMIGQTTPLNIALAWAYVVIRIVHSIWQIGVNIIIVRFALFFVSTLALLILTVNAVRALL